MTTSKIQSDNSKYVAKIKEQEELIAGYKNALYYINTHLKTQVGVKKCDCESKARVFETENAELKHKNSDLAKETSKLQMEFQKERTVFASDRRKSDKKFSDFSNKVAEEKKAIELRCIKLSKQNSDFEKVLFLEKEKFEKERMDFDVERKSFETKSTELSLKISNLEKELDIERKELEKKKVDDFQAKSVKDVYSDERKVFQAEISKLSKRLSTLATEAMKEQKIKSDLQKKFDLIFRERNVLSDKVQELEAINIVELSEQSSADSIVQSPYDDSTDSECSFKSASGSIHEHLSSAKSVKSSTPSKDQMRPSNLFYNHAATSSDIPIFKPVKMVWRAKGSTPERNAPKSSVPPPKVNKKNNAPKGKPFVKPNLVYSANHLIRIAQKHICCSYCGTHDFIKKEDVPYWYGTYNIPSNRTAHNKPGPKFHWVPKST